MSQLQSGSTFADYRIEEFCGKGGMGVVYRATQLSLDRAVALKLIVTELADNPMFRDRFKRESQLAASIEHPNVIPIYETGEGDGRLFIAMRYVDGDDLRDRLAARGPLSPAHAVRIVSQLGAALDAAHGRGLVHRDVKPGNVLLAGDPDEHVYLTDFGLTKHIGSITITRAGDIVGTADYCSPEQIRGEHLDARADVYSLGCLLFECLTGRAPYERDTEVATIWAHLTSPPPAATTHVRDLPSGFDAVIARAMAKDRDERFPSGGDVGRAAVAAFERSALPTRGHSVARGSAAPAGSSRAAPISSSWGLGDERHRGRAWSRRRWPVVAAGLLTLALAAAVLSPAREALTGGDGVTTIPVGDGPSAIAIHEGDAWVTNGDGNTISHIDTASAEVVGEPFPVGEAPSGLAVDDDSLWVSIIGDGLVRHIPVNPEPLGGRAVPVGRGPTGVAIGKRFVWVASQGQNTVTRIDRATQAVVGAPIPVGSVPTELVEAGGFLWVTNRASANVSRLDARTGRPVGRPIPVGAEPRGIAAGAGSVWVTNYGDDSVSRLAVDTGDVVQRIPAGNDPVDLVVGEGDVWVTNNGDDTVIRLDARRGTVVGDPIEVGSNPVGIALSADGVWVTNAGEGTVSRIAR